MGNFSATGIHKENVSWREQGSYRYIMARTRQLPVYHGENKLHFDEMIMMFTLTKLTFLVGFLQCQLAETTEQSTGRHVGLLEHIILIPSLQPVCALTP